MKNYESYFSFYNLFKANEEYGIDFIIIDDEGRKHLINEKTYKGYVNTLATWHKIEEAMEIKIHCAILEHARSSSIILFKGYSLKNQYTIAINTILKK